MLNSFIPLDICKLKLNFIDTQQIVIKREQLNCKNVKERKNITMIIKLKITFIKKKEQLKFAYLCIH